MDRSLQLWQAALNENSDCPVGEEPWRGKREARGIEAWAGGVIYRNNFFARNHRKVVYLRHSSFAPDCSPCAFPVRLVLVVAFAAVVIGNTIGG